MKTVEVKSRSIDPARLVSASTAETGDANEVDHFVRANKLGQYLEIASSLISKYFPSAGEIMMERREDPEFEDEWLTLGIRASGDVEIVLNAYDHLTRDLAAGLPPEVSSKIRISIQRV